MSVACPDAEEVAALLSHAIDPARRAEILDHAASCQTCYALVQQVADALVTLATDDSARDAAPASGSPPEPPPRPPEPESPPRASWNKIGRYHLLELVGAGGMGIVWGAWDPQLTRRIALKLVHPRLGAARERILAEGQALGKLSHPNVVPVYDVGLVDNQVYLVMEWVQGTTLRAYAATAATTREVVDAYRQAGEGLAAAHRAGLIHRDFKPDNAIRGDDGRVRVLDFGLARSDSGEGDGRAAGTPRYMAPEQATGKAITTAADQYAFAVSLREALSRRGELPSWLAAIVARGAAADPAARFATMEDLLRALGRDPASVWRQRAIAIAALAAAGTAYALGKSGADAPPTCVGSPAEIALSWGPAERAQVAQQLRGLGAFAAGEVERLTTELDHYADTWADVHRRACVAHRDSGLPTAHYEQRLACLARGRAQLASVAEVLGGVTAAGLPAALIAARSLPSIAACQVGDAASAPLPTEAVGLQVSALAPAIERAQVFAAAGRPDAAAIAQASVAAAEHTGYAPLIARALVAQGRAASALNLGEAPARAALERAVQLAVRGGDDVLAVEAYARLVWAVSRYRGDIVDGWPVIEALAARTGPLGRFARALLYNNKATARLSVEDRVGARALLESALRELPSTPNTGELELVSVRRNFALVTDDPARREAQAQQLVAELEARLGPNHPETLSARVLAAVLARDLVAAARGFQIACDGYERWHPDRVVAQVDCAFERGWIADELGDERGALAAMQRAASDPLSPAQRGRGTIAAAFVAIARGDIAATALRALDALGREESPSPQWWTRGEAADAHLVAARGWALLGRPADADASLRAALAALETVRQPMYARRLARARAALGRR